jgi:hypothetical protein
MRYDKLVKEDPLKDGDWVLLHRPYKIKEKFKPNWVGPYEVIKATPYGVYHLRDPIGKELSHPFHRDLLKRCIVNERPTALWTDEQLESSDDDLTTALLEDQGRYDNDRVFNQLQTSLNTDDWDTVRALLPWKAIWKDPAGKS